MRFTPIVQLLSVIALSSLVWGQGGRGRGAQTGNQPAATNQTGAAGNAAGRGGPGAQPSNDFYNYDPNVVTGPPIREEPPIETHQKITLNGEALAYTARVGFLPLHNATTGQSEAHLFYTSYSKDGVSDPSTRPICFFLGGAPGVSAAWQDFGGLGPKRMKPDSAPPAENPNTILGQTDLVFVNPVGTGFSRPDLPSHGPNFWNTTGDLSSLGEFVRSFITHYNRGASPIFLAGEDSGTGRVAGLAAYLDEHQIPVRGVALFAMTLSADSIAGDEQYITLLPSLVMSAWFHKKLSPELSQMSAEQIAGQARQFASREYLHALYKGDRMTGEERTKVIADLSRLTGLSKAFVVNNNLRISLERFNSELMRDQHSGLSSSDARVTGFMPAPPAGGRGGGGGGGFGGAPPVSIDFNLSSLSGKLLASYENYLRSELGFKGNADEIFYLMSGGIGTFTSTGSDDASLSVAFARNPNLRLFVALNYYDLGAPFYASEFTLAHLNVSPEVRAHNITIGRYEAGQMTYLDNKEIVRLQRDLSAFLNETATRK
jgi:carboxypeptidase C (cathepsin A)